MADRAREQRLQLLLSWRRKALAAGPDTPFDRKRYDSFDDCRADHLRRAAEAIAGFRVDVRAQMDKLATARFGLQREQQALPELVRGGKLKPVDANRRNRKLRQHIEACEAELARYNVLLSAEDPSETGGFVELPLEKYAQKTNAPAPAPGKDTRAAKRSVWRRVLAVLNNNWVQAGAGVVGVVAAVVAVLYCTTWSGGVDFEAGATYPPSHLRLVCENNTQSDAVFHAPWAEGRPASGDGNIGVEVFITDRDGHSRLFPTGDLWTFQGASTVGKDPVKIRPGTRAEFLLDMDTLRIRNGGHSLGNVTLQCTTRYGRRLFSYRYEDRQGAPWKKR